LVSQRRKEWVKGTPRPLPPKVLVFMEMAG